MICSAMLEAQLDLMVQPAEAGSMQPEASRSSAPQSNGTPPPPAAAAPPSLDLEEWLLSDVVWDPFDMVRCRVRCCRCRPRPPP